MPDEHMHTANVKGVPPDPLHPAGGTHHVNSGRAQRARRSCWLGMAGGLLLAGSFFMPAVQGCNLPVVPAEEAWDAVTDGPSWDWLPLFCLYVAAYLFGLLVLLAAIGRMAGLKRLERAAARGVPILVLAVALTLLGRSAVESLQGVPLIAGFSFDEILVLLHTVVLPLAALLYLWRVRRLEERRLAHMFLGSGWCVLWFGTYLFICLLTQTTTFHGLWCSLAGSIIILTATVGATTAAIGQPYPRSFGRLLAGRGLEPEDGSRCVSCGYLLYGLPEPRCPECGREFDPTGFGPLLVPNDGTGSPKNQVDPRV